MKFLCRLGIHNYGKWEFVKEGHVAEVGGSGLAKNAPIIVQKVTCDDCNYVKQEMRISKEIK